MVNGSRYYRALERVGIASALSSDTILPMPDPSPSTLTVQTELQLPTARKKEWWPATAGSLPKKVTCQHCDTYYTLGLLNLAGFEPTTFRLLVRRATSSPTD